MFSKLSFDTKATLVGCLVFIGFTMLVGCVAVAVHFINNSSL
jgi:hypothetical protein